MKYSSFDSLIENRKFQKFQLHSPSGLHFMPILRISLLNLRTKCDLEHFQGTLKSLKTYINFRFWGQFRSLTTFRYIFRWSWNFQKSMQVRFTSDLRRFQVAKIFFQDQGVHKFAKNPIWDIWLNFWC